MAQSSIFLHGLGFSRILTGTGVSTTHTIIVTCNSKLPWDNFSNAGLTNWSGSWSLDCFCLDAGKRFLFFRKYWWSIILIVSKAFKLKFNRLIGLSCHFCPLPNASHMERVSPNWWPPISETVPQTRLFYPCSNVDSGPKLEYRNRLQNIGAEVICLMALPRNRWRFVTIRPLTPVAAWLRDSGGNLE